MGAGIGNERKYLFIDEEGEEIQMLSTQGAFPATVRGTEMQKGAKGAFHNDMLKRLAKKPWIADHSGHVPPWIEY